MLKKLIVQNYKGLKDFSLDLNPDINIIVGDNEVGKSTILEAIHLVFTSQLNGSNISFELSPFLFNTETVNLYIEDLRAGKKTPPPRILIEAYMDDVADLAKLSGTNNTQKENVPGIYLSIQFNEDYAEEYAKYVEDPKRITTVPVEYYEVKCCSFANNSLSQRGIPINTTLIDTTHSKKRSGTDQYISKIINDYLQPKDRAALALNFRTLKETFANEDGISGINKELKSKQGVISDKQLKVSVDISSKTNWEANLTSYLDDIPFHFIGKGEQNSVKMKLALESQRKESQVILIEEPENHLSFSNMSRLISNISERCKGKQLVITTHSTFVLNKLGIEKVILLDATKIPIHLNNLSPTTQDYFKKLPGYNTLRLLLSKRPILVEGPSDELIVQKGYLQTQNKLPIEDGIDVIAVGALAFKRFLEIAKILKKEVHVITDNDGNCKALKEKYKDFDGEPFIKIHYDQDEALTTLEPQIVNVNSLEDLNQVLKRKDKTKEEIVHYMVNNKTESALKIFESPVSLNIPKYIDDALKK